MRLLYVEDTYGEGFHNKLLEKLKENGISLCDVKVRVPPSFPCRKKITRIIKMDALSAVCKKDKRSKSMKRANIIPFRALVVVDSEEHSFTEVIRRVSSHFKGEKLRICGQKYEMNKIVKVGVVVQAHESWLCYGLLRDSKCKRKDWAIDKLARYKGEWRKEWLSDWARKIHVEWLLDLPDFKRYLRLLAWLCQ